MKRGFPFPAVTTLALAALLASLAPPAGAANIVDGGPEVGKWKTWVLASGSEIQPPPPPADDSARTQAELAELRQLQSQRSPITNTAIQFFNGVPATQRWTELALSVINASPTQSARQHAILHTAMYDAMVATWQAKYTYNRRAPGLLARDLTPAIAVSPEPSYPSEHAAIAGAAAGVLAGLYPAAAPTITALAQEALQTRLQAGANYRSDVDAGLALGQAVAQKALARAAADGSDARWTGTVPTSPGLWAGKDPVDPLAGTWKTWLLPSGSQVRPAPPPAFGSPQFLAELAEVKQINTHPTPSQLAIAMGRGVTTLADWRSSIPYSIIAHEGLGTPRAARVMALLNAAVADALIAAWDAKYLYWRVTPVQADPTIKPLIPQLNAPNYPSMGGTLVPAAAAVLARFFPQDGPRLRNLEEIQVQQLLYGGVHLRTDLEAGAQVGRAVADFAAQRDRLIGG